MSRRRIFWLAFSLILLAPLLAGCSYNPWDPTRWMNQEQLQLPHLVWAAGLSRLPNADGGSGGVISSLTTFRRAGDGAQQVLVAQGDWKTDSLHVVGLDGSGDHRLDMGADCLTATVTPDGRWIDCLSSLKDGGDALQMATLEGNGTITGMHQAQLHGGDYYSSEKWSPDGRYLALVVDCSVTVFASPPPHSAFTSVLHITSAAFNQEIGCLSDINAWSTDSARLRLVTDDGSGTPIMDDVDVGQLLTGLNEAPTIDIPSSDFHAVDKGAPIQMSGWYPTAKMFLYLTQKGNEESLRGVDPTTGEIRTLVTVNYPVYHISDYSWTADGSQVLLVVNGDACVDCNAAYRSDIYLYTP